MNAKDIKEIIAELHKNGRVKIVTLIDGTTHTDGLRGNAIVFDQDELIAHSFGINNLSNSAATQVKNPYTITSFKYDKILSIKTIITKDGLDIALDDLLANEVISEAKKKELLQTMDLEEIYKRVDPLR